MRLYGLKTCDTCRKALKSLIGAGLEVQFVDVRADGIAPDLLARAFVQFGDALVNTRSTTWRGLSEEQRAAPPLEVLAAHPTLMKRPLIERDDQLFLSWGKDVQAALLG